MNPETDLRIYHDRQGIWASDGSKVEQHKSSPAEVLLHYRPKAVRLFGMCSQAESILAAAAAGPVLGYQPQVWVGSPALIGRGREPSAILQSMTNLAGLSPYFGGWHPFADTDLRTYKLLDAMFRYDVAGSVELIKDHPAYPALSFIHDRGLSHLDKCNLVFNIEDPRWFHRDVNHPDRESRLRMFLGITPRNVTNLLDGKKLTGYNCKKLSILLHLLYDKSDGLSVPEQPSNKPSQFCQMMFNKLTKDSGPYVAFMKALEMVVSFIRQVWLHEIAPAGREVFLPQYFFESLGKKGEAVAESYIRHRANLPHKKAGLKVT